jgi:hypothetical protein
MTLTAIGIAGISKRAPFAAEPAKAGVKLGHER